MECLQDTDGKEVDIMGYMETRAGKERREGGYRKKEKEGAKQYLY